jgi:hypothetical protein
LIDVLDQVEQALISYEVTVLIRRTAWLRVPEEIK